MAQRRTAWPEGSIRLAVQVVCAIEYGRFWSRLSPSDVAELGNCAGGDTKVKQNREVNSLVTGCKRKPVQSLQESSRPPMTQRRALPGATNSGSEKTSPTVD